MEHHCHRSPILISFLVVFNLLVAEAEVITLTADTFNDKVKEKDTAWFVQFCVPWCKHCKNLGHCGRTWGKQWNVRIRYRLDKLIVVRVNQCAPKLIFIHILHSSSFIMEKNSQNTKGLERSSQLKTFVLEEAEKTATKAQLESEKEL